MQLSCSIYVHTHTHAHIYIYTHTDPLKPRAAGTQRETEREREKIKTERERKRAVRPKRGGGGGEACMYVHTHAHTHRDYTILCVCVCVRVSDVCVGGFTRTGACLLSAGVSWPVLPLLSQSVCCPNRHRDGTSVSAAEFTVRKTRFFTTSAFFPPKTSCFLLGDAVTYRVAGVASVAVSLT